MVRDEKEKKAIEDKQKKKVKGELDKPEKDKADKAGKKDKGEKKDKEKTERLQTNNPKAAMRAAKAAATPADPNDYLAGCDLPSEGSDGEEYERSARAGEEVVAPRFGGSHGEAKKVADRERKAAEKAYQIRLEALREDDNVFDVAFEGQGDDKAISSALDVKVSSLTIRAKGKLLLESTNLTIAAGRRYGLAGPNGKGKSTLMRLLAKRQIPVPDGIDVLLVEQEIVGSESTALQAVVEADVELMGLRDEEKQLNAKLLDPDVAKEEDPDFVQEDAQARINEVYERMSAIAGSTAESRASKILHGLGFDTKMQARSTQSFSGGWRMRISIARALYIQPTLLLLDEPTNHLDLRAVLWLEEYLMRYKKTLVVVSHDRDFLNSVTTDIIHLHDFKLHQYKGNFAQFEEMYEQKRREVNKAFDKYEKQIKSAKSGGGPVSSKKAQEKVKGEAAKKLAKGRKGDEGGGGDREAASAPQRWSDYTVEFHFPEPTELNPPLIQLIDVDFKYPNRDDFGLQGLNMGVDMGSRIAIVGPNGAGKTTLMNLLSGDLVPTAGEQRRSHKLRIGRYAQHFVDALEMDVNPTEYLMEKFPTAGLKPEQMRAMLGRFGLSGAHHLTPICKLSGGQKSRVVFTAVSLMAPHILLFDEPTNHLDMQSIDALCDAVEEFEGGVIVISHDAQLLSRLCADRERSQVLVVEDGKIRHYDGDFLEYREELVKEIQAELDDD
ncbi:hypothetical protein FOA52_003344 [Chlamydomonas sp. UWO 241]|nr:hypothetical protein FOA52_003344 [Chlamydomonas sp. UWO 241]